MYSGLTWTFPRHNTLQKWKYLKSCSLSRLVTFTMCSTAKFTMSYQILSFRVRRHQLYQLSDTLSLEWLRLSDYWWFPDSHISCCISYRTCLDVVILHLVCNLHLQIIAKMVIIPTSVPEIWVVCLLKCLIIIDVLLYIRNYQVPKKTHFVLVSFDTVTLSHINLFLVSVSSTESTNRPLFCLCCLHIQVIRQQSLYHVSL